MMKPAMLPTWQTLTYSAAGTPGKIGGLRARDEHQSGR
jgi:hypothetical protein